MLVRKAQAADVGAIDALYRRVASTPGGIARLVRGSKRKAIAFYESLGFVQEGKFRGRIRNLDGSLEADIPMAWTRPAITGRAAGVPATSDTILC